VPVTKKRLLILGIGNLLMGDEGVGVHAIRALEQETLPPEVDLLDGGTGGFHLLSCFDQCAQMILVDATLDGHEPGTVAVIKPQFLSDYPRSLGAHDIGLRDLLESATLLGPLPVMHLVTISIAEIQSATTELSPLVQQSLPQVIKAVRQILNAEGFADADVAS
jgi:hydrogenase maturation protease